MKFRARFTGELKLTKHTPNAHSIGNSRQVKQTEVIEITDKAAAMFKDSIGIHVKAGLLVPVDTDAKAAFKK